MVDYVANLFIETLRDLLVEETRFLFSVSGDVEQVKRDLKRIHALLMKADRERSDSPTLKIYVAELKDVAFEAENVLEKYAVEVESKKEGRRNLKEKFGRYMCILCECSSVHEVGKDTQDILRRLTDLTGNLESEFGKQTPSSSSHGESDLLRQTYAHEVEPHFVGMEVDIMLLVSMVKGEATRRHRVIKLYGMGGLGKTTLARKIYSHDDVASSYTRAWVCVTQQFNAKAVFGMILKQLDEKAHNDSMGVPELVEKIYGFMKKKDCLIVIDDVWENDHWEIMKKAFPINCNVLLTTRSESVANDQDCNPYKLDCLTEDQGWLLLQKIAGLSTVEKGLKPLEDIGRQIVLKCGCLPLSISVIGGILCQKEEDNLAEWNKVNLNMDSYLRHGEGVGEYKRVKQVLDLSYDALPYYLKPCFLYLACFPDDEEIETERLYLLWMAEGFISYQDKGENESLRDVAERYLNELAMRCMVQVHKTETYSPHKKFDSCRLHDLMYELCSSKVEEENLVKRVAISRYQDFISTPSTSHTKSRLALPSTISNSVSRLAIIVDGDTKTLCIDGLEKLKDLRSFMLLDKAGYLFQRIYFEDSVTNFEKSQSLRILLLDYCEFEGKKLPRKLSKLIHLRYLGLRLSLVEELPQFVCRMPYLQTLDLRVTGIIRLPNVIWTMKRLRHLFLFPDMIEVIEGEKLRLEGLDDLETLEEISSDIACIVDITKLMKLRKLSVEVSDMNSMIALAKHMSSNKGQLCEIVLKVEWCEFELRYFGELVEITFSDHIEGMQMHYQWWLSLLQTRDVSEFTRFDDF